MKKLLLSLLCALSVNSYAEEQTTAPGQVNTTPAPEQKSTQTEQPQVEPKNQSSHALAFIDMSSESMQWLKENHTLLKEKEVLVMLIGGGEQEATKLNKKYGILIGPSPDEKMTELLLKSFNIKALPALVGGKDERNAKSQQSEN